MTDAIHDCPKCHGSGETSPRGYSTADPKPCPTCEWGRGLLADMKEKCAKVAEKHKYFSDLDWDSRSGRRAQHNVDKNMVRIAKVIRALP